MEDCTAHRYHCTRVPDVDLCAVCFSRGRLAAGTASADYLRVEADASRSTEAGAWSDQETLSLLEGIELFGENWQQVQETPPCCDERRRKGGYRQRFMGVDSTGVHECVNTRETFAKAMRR